MAFAQAVDDVAAAYKVARDAIESEVDDNGEQALQPLLNWIMVRRAELTRERDAAVHKLPLLSDGVWIRALFADTTSLRIGEQIDKLVGGELEPALDPLVHYADKVEKPFHGEPKMEDVRQGGLGDCWLLSPLLALLNSAAGRQHLQAMIHPHDEAAEVYTVDLYRKDGETFEKLSVSLSARFPARHSPQQGRDVFAYAHGGLPVSQPLPLWPLILEKAFAAHLKGYKELQGSESGARMAFEAILGKEAPRGGGPLGTPLNGAKAQAQVMNLVRSGKMVVVSSRTHYRSVVDVSPGEVGLILRNPHGHHEELSWAQLHDFVYEVGPDLQRRDPAGPTGCSPSQAQPRCTLHLLRPHFT